MKSGTVKAKLPGEISGPSVIFDLEIENSTDRLLDLNTLVVTVLDAQQAPANRITTTPAKAMPQSVASGGKAAGTFVFNVAPDQRDPITVQVTVSADTNVVAFKGPVG